MTRFSLYSESPNAWKIVFEEDEGVWYEALDYPRFFNLNAARFVVSALNADDALNNPPIEL